MEWNGGRLEKKRPPRSVGGTSLYGFEQCSAPFGSILAVLTKISSLIFCPILKELSSSFIPGLFAFVMEPASTSKEEAPKDDRVQKVSEGSSKSEDNPSTSSGPQTGAGAHPGKRKHHRRAKKSRKRPDVESTDHLSSKRSRNPSNQSPATVPRGALANRGSNRGGGGGGGRRRHQNQVYLRPTNGPLLNAPKNSTQFIIDDHENSNLFYDFGEHGEERDSGPPPPEGEQQDPDSSRQHEHHPSPDDDTFWAEYSERDFQAAYETAHQEEIAEWDRKRLVDEISALERRQKELVNVLSRLDPEVYLQKLQTELIKLQEANKALKEERATLQPCLPDSSTNDAGGGGSGGGGIGGGGDLVKGSET